MWVASKSGDRACTATNHGVKSAVCLSVSPGSWVGLQGLEDAERVVYLRRIFGARETHRERRALRQRQGVLSVEGDSCKALCIAVVLEHGGCSVVDGSGHRVQQQHQGDGTARRLCPVVQRTPDRSIVQASELSCLCALTFWVLGQPAARVEVVFVGAEPCRQDVRAACAILRWVIVHGDLLWIVRCRWSGLP
jgi:hypothetical protein